MTNPQQNYNPMLSKQEQYHLNVAYLNACTMHVMTTSEALVEHYWHYVDGLKEKGLNVVSVKCDDTNNVPIEERNGTNFPVIDVIVQGAEDLISYHITPDTIKVHTALYDSKYLGTKPDGTRRKAMVCFSMGLDSTGLAFYLKYRGWDVTLAYFDDGPWNTPHDYFYDANRPICTDDFLAKESDFYANLHASTSGFKVAKFRYPQLNALAVQPGVGQAADTDKAKFAESLGMTYWVGYKMLMQGILLSHGAAYGYDLVVMGHLPGEDAYRDEEPHVFDKMREAYEYAYPRTPMPLFENPYYDWNFTKTEVIQLGYATGTPFKDTYSCRRTPAKPVEERNGSYLHLLGYSHCGVCEMCQLREEAFAKADQEEPAYWDGK